MSPFRLLYNLPLRYKLLISYWGVIIVAVTLVSTVIYSLVRRTVEANIESELSNSTETILNMVRTSVTVSIKNHLRAAAERNREIVEHLHNSSLRGEITEDEARQQAMSMLLSQRIGQTGYIYCINSQGDVVVHPKRALHLVNVLDFEFVREQTLKKEGYVEYNWKNPDETSYRPKALYMTYFAPWDWIISVSSYREEFRSLVNVEDFQESILSLRFGQTGYSFVIDSKGNVVVHPKLHQDNLSDASDTQLSFIQELTGRKSGKIFYTWRNPDEDAPRAKFVLFKYIPELDWIVASSIYLNELYAPLMSLRNIVLITGAASLLLALPLTLRISRSITNPLKKAMDRFASGATGDFTARMESSSGDELGQLASYFNTFMTQLEAYSTSLQGEILERKQAEEALRRSEEMFSKAFRSSPHGICLVSLDDGRFIDVNASLLAVTSFSREDLVGKTPAEADLFPDRDVVSKLLESLLARGALRSLEIEFLTRSRQMRTGLLSAEVIELEQGSCMLLNIEDVTDSRLLEREIMEISDKERQKLGQDLHDDLCPHLIGIEVLSKVLGKKLGEKGLSEAADAEKIRRLIKDATDKTRGLARGLCPVYLVEDGLESALRELAVSVQAVFGVSCRFECHYPVLIHDNAVATNLFRIAQEAANNAARHGRASLILIELSLENGRIMLKVHDDGCGIPQSPPSGGMGLHIMSYRARMIGATIEIKRGAEQGVTLACSLRNSPQEA